jgi:hypothetical protein
MKKIRILHIVLIALTVLSLTSIAASGDRVFTITLTGAAEAPGPGDPDGTGTATLTLNRRHGTVCWEINVSGITLPATAAHIHVAPVGVAGPVVVPLSAPDGHGFASGCTDASPDLIRQIIRHPDQYYVNVHNADFPGGAVRGQLP